MSGYKELYEYCQTLEPKISRKQILAKVLEITKTEKVTIVKTGLDVSICRGLFFSATNTKHAIVRQIGTNIISIARGQKYCWDRFVTTKEMMHLFDTPKQVAANELKLDAILAGFNLPSDDEVAKSEYLGFWMALACLCPEKKRLEFKAAVEANHLDFYSIALQLRIPEQYVPLLFQDRYRVIVDELLS